VHDSVEHLLRGTHRILRGEQPELVDRRVERDKPRRIVQALLDNAVSVGLRGLIDEADEHTLASGGFLAEALFPALEVVRKPVGSDRLPKL
jgi:hypothetical protein